jgi:hypothetical protein
MWICLNDAFVSAVSNGRGALKVRARKRAHLAKLFPALKIHESNATDYRFRIFIAKAAFAEVVTKKLLAIDYSNFKDSVKDKKLHDLYADFWWLHRKYQEKSKSKKTKSENSGYDAEYKIGGQALF